jgi:hypothetical protein
MTVDSMKEDQMHSTETLLRRRAPYVTTTLAMTTLHLLLAIAVFIRALGMVLYLHHHKIGREPHLHLQVPRLMAGL